MKSRRIRVLLFFLLLVICASLFSALWIGVDNKWCSARIRWDLRGTPVENIRCEVFNPEGTSGFQVIFSRNAPYFGFRAFKDNDCLIGFGTPSRDLRPMIWLLALLTGSGLLFGVGTRLRRRVPTPPMSE